MKNNQQHDYFVENRIQNSIDIVNFTKNSYTQDFLRLEKQQVLMEQVNLDKRLKTLQAHRKEKDEQKLHTPNNQNSYRNDYYRNKQHTGTDTNQNIARILHEARNDLAQTS
jgi:hypothetical protein